MKKRLVKIVSIILAVSLIIGLMMTFVSCNKSKDDTSIIEKVYKSHKSFDEFTGYSQELVLPAGWSVYLTSSSSSSESNDVRSDVGYIPSIDAFVISCKDSSGDVCLSLVRCGDENVYFDGGIKGMLFPITIGVSQLRVSNGLIAVKFKNGQCAVYNKKAQIVFSRANTKINSNNIDLCLKVLDEGLIAVAADSDVNGVDNYTSIYRPTTSGDKDKRGALCCYIKNDEETLTQTYGFDSKYVSIADSYKVAQYVFAIPETTSETVPKYNSGEGVITNTNEDDYYCEITYIGNGKFFIHIDYKVQSTDEYTYWDGTDYYFVKRYLYYPDTQKKETYTANADKIFLNLTNSYYDSVKGEVDVREFLNKGYSYASYGMFIQESNGVKKGFYDQYILDDNLNVVMSLTGNEGVSLSIDDKGEVNAFDLLWFNTDGIYYCPFYPSVVKFYDAKGNLLGENNTYQVIEQNYANGIVVAKVEDPEDPEEFLYGAFNLDGTIAVEFKYDSLTSFRGYYALGERDGEIFIVGQDGKEVDHMSDLSVALSDIATTSANSFIYKIGAYMYKEVKDGTSYYGIKNLNPNISKNVVMKAKMSAGATLYAPASSTADVFVFEKLTAEDSTVTYIIYRLK